jgi:RHS repeat-associated protein
VTTLTASGSEAVRVENRVKAVDVLTWPHIGVRRPESPDRCWENRVRYDGKAVGTVVARYYDPAIGQFLTVDPDVATTLSPYGYVQGDPLNSSDPGGLMNDASSGSFGYYTSGPEAGCEVNLSGGAALCPTGGGQVAPMGSGVPGASWGRFLLGAAVVLTVGAVAEAALPEVAGAGEGAEAAAADDAAASSAADAAGAPPGYNPDTWDTGPASQESNSETHYWDENGGEWRWHAPDDWHSVGHWDYNPWDEWNSPWQNIYPETAMLIGPGAC